jgi:Gpi18-like mannosyltransferase
LAAISYVNISSLHLIKLLSVLFDLVLAYYAMRIVGLFATNPVRRLVAFFVVLFLPTVILNGALWGSATAFMHRLRHERLLCSNGKARPLGGRHRVVLFL